MYQSGVICTDCHEPHGLKLRAPGDQVCARCHATAKYQAKSHHFHEGGSKGASCVACHMPATTYMVIDPRRDHGLRVPRPDLTVAIGTPNACNGCHADRDAAWSAARVREWLGRDARGHQNFAGALHAGRTGSVDAEQRLVALVRDGEQPAIARASALAELRRFPGPQSLAAVRLGLPDVDPLVRHAALGTLEFMPPPERLPLASPLLADPVRAVRIAAARLLASIPVGSISAELRPRLESGWREWIAAQRIDADRPEARTNLGTFYAERGDGAAAEAELRQAIRMRPDFATAYVNLADVLRASGRDVEGERVLRDGLARSSSDGDLHHALGLLLVRRGQHAEALIELEKAARLRPGEARYAYVLGVALNSAGDSKRALSELEAAHDRHPADREILWALATISRGAGRIAEAARHAARLLELSPEDPAAQRLARELGKR
jgi:predicted CXXCH cytochrome family protein